jgi:hypothetical protein
MARSRANSHSRDYLGPVVDSDPLGRLLSELRHKPADGRPEAAHALRRFVEQQEHELSPEHFLKV